MGRRCGYRASDAALLAADEGAHGTASGRGVLSTTSRAAFLERMASYLGSIRFSCYEDTKAPVVAVSADGTLGWLACEMRAEGTRNVAGTRTPLSYGFSWVEMWAAAPGRGEGRPRWVRIGNASSERAP